MGERGGRFWERQDDEVGQACSDKLLSPVQYENSPWWAVGGGYTQLRVTLGSEGCFYVGDFMCFGLSLRGPMGPRTLAMAHAACE